LYKQNLLSVPVKNTYTNDQGKYQLAEIDTGKYTIFFTHTGFSEKQQDIIAASDQPLLLKEILLNPVAANLKDVTVTTRKPLVEQTDDKVIFNVENDPVAKTETAIDIYAKRHL
jgi:hypothetical protein